MKGCINLSGQNIADIEIMQNATCIVNRDESYLINAKSGEEW